MELCLFPDGQFKLATRAQLLQRNRARSLSLELLGEPKQIHEKQEILID
jgi:hypothetical protein